MKIIDTNNNSFPMTDEISLLIGFFDGVHLGHQKLINEALKFALTIGVLTFTDSLAETKKQKLLLDEDSKQESLASHGVSYYFKLNFNSIKNWSKEHFLEYLSAKNIKRIFVSSDFTFGKNKSGNIKDLINHFNKQEEIVKIVSPVVLTDGTKISSTYIRSLLNKGLIEEANSLLGYKYFRKGIVVHGLHNGTKLGFPTANIKPDNSLVKIKDGVYKTHAHVDNKSYLSMTNIGSHPTIDQLFESIIETHIFDFDSDIYDKQITISFDSFIRPQIKFDSLDALKKQLHKDKDFILNQH